jgi:predicted flap endonuclease-1-like 5' DNA nuclease
VNLSDLYRIKGVGSEYSDLLEEAGVDTIVELSKRVAKNLFEKMVEVNTKKKLVRKLPTEAQVADWVDQAKKLPRKVSY